MADEHVPKSGHADDCEFLCNPCWNQRRADEAMYPYMESGSQ